MDDREIKLNERHLGLRAVAFFLALVLAAGAFGMGIRGIRARSEGYYRIEPRDSEEAARYAKQVRLDVYLAGSSTEIRAAQQRLRQAYGGLLLRYVRLLDPWETFDSSANLALLNRAPGETVRVDPLLLPLLADALDKTGEGRGYSLFAGPFYQAWEQLRYLEDPLPFDPEHDPETAERLRAFGELAADPAAFRLAVEDAEAGRVRLEVSAEARTVLEALEYEGPILDLNLLGEAYLLRLLAAELEALGCTEGYLTGAGGTALALSGNRAGDYALYARGPAAVEPAAVSPAAPGTAFCALRAFPLPEEPYGYYPLTAEPEAGARTVYRHPNVPCTGVPAAGVLDAAAVLDPAGDPVAARWACLLLFFSPQVPGAEGAAPEGLPAAWTLSAGEEQTVFTNAGGNARFTAPEGTAWRVR